MGCRSMSAFDAVDGSSTGTGVPWKWVPIRRHTKVAAIALANKIARMAWAIMAKGEHYKEPVALAA